MKSSAIYDRLTDMLLTAESDIKFFQKTRNDVDSYKRVLKSFFNKKVFQQCVTELEIAHDRLSRSKIVFCDFYKKNRHAFSGAAQKHIDAYMDYLNYATVVAEQRLMLQRIILDIKVNRTIKPDEINLPKMFDELDEMYEECRSKAIIVNKMAEKLKKA